MSGQRNDRDLVRGLVRLDAACGLPPVHFREAEVHQDEIGMFRFGDLHGFGTVHGEKELVPLSLEPPGEHVAIQLVVLDQ
jgi:hypothetical protein